MNDPTHPVRPGPGPEPDRGSGSALATLGRNLAVVALVLAIPIVPYALWGDASERVIQGWCEEAASPATAAAIVAAVLAGDPLLPVPSSFVSTFAGAKLGPVLGTLAVWAGMSVGAVAAFALARWLGAPRLARWATRRDENALRDLWARWGAPTLVVTRPLPVLAEASVLLAGAAKLGWRPFLAVTLTSNLGIALAYALAGHWARQQQALGWALSASIGLPLLAAAAARYYWGRAQPPISESTR